MPDAASLAAFFAVDVTGDYERKLESSARTKPFFSGDQAQLLEKYAAKDRYVGSLVGGDYAEVFKARNTPIVSDPGSFQIEGSG